MTRSFKLGALSLALGLAATAGTAVADDAWLKKAQLGPYAPETQDWTAIEEAARAEGSVVLYSVSSRFPKLVEGFKEKYGIDLVGHDMASDLQLEKFRREHKAGVYNVDVLYNSEAPLLLGEALPNQLVWNFVPDTVADELDDGEKEPLLVQRHSSRTFFYNTALNPDGPPVDNIWDLTRDEWRGRVLLASPLKDSIAATFIQTILRHPDEMEKAYEAEFGEPIKYSEEVEEAVKENPGIEEPNAAIEWLHRFLSNEPVFQESATKIFNNIADIKQKNPPIGISTFSKLRSNEEGIYEAAPLYDMEPFFGVTYPTSLMIADNAPHPNAAKLLIRYMMDEGFAPWDEPGDYAARSSFEKEQIEKYELYPFEELKLWKVDSENAYDTKYEFLALYLALS